MTPLWARAQPKEGVAAWLAAEATQGKALCEAAAAFARLDERLLAHPARDALNARLALREAADLAWANGDRVRLARLALYRVDRAAGLMDNPQALLKADWLYRKLLQPGAPVDMQTLRTLLGDETEAKGWETAMQALDPAHPLTRAAAGFHLARAAGLSPPGCMAEAALIAARLGAMGGKGGAVFMPLVAGHPVSGGDVQDRLAAMLAAIAQAAAQARAEIIQLEDWAARATETTANLSGRSAPALRELLIRHPVLSAPMAAKEANISKDAALRNLRLFQERGLIIEITGHARFRYWTIRA